MFLKVAEEDDDHTDEFKRQKLEEVTDGKFVKYLYFIVNFKMEKNKVDKWLVYAENFM